MTVDNNTTLGATRGALVHRTDWTDYESPSTAVVVAVANATGADQRELAVLNDHIDGDALDALVTDSPSTVEVSFDYDGVGVTVSADGTIDIDP